MGKSIFYDRLLTLIRKSGKTVNCIEKELGYPRNALHNYKYGGEPSGSRLIELSYYFHISPEYLMGKTNEIKSPLNLIDIFENLDETQKIELLKISQEWGYKKIKNL
ncbi:XRE family transcriptional regulator [Lactococcus lactis]|uniref:XRE family transcriptional regulator n=1 Tax=Lactococcus lactis TaxID=1358 RepID=UPI0024A8E253|nr:XRE family transcriptional regulator [Lactococcus lactis]